jgi:hypothetical protein
MLIKNPDASREQLLIDPEAGESPTDVSRLKLR